MFFFETQRRVFKFLLTALLNYVIASYGLMRDFIMTSLSKLPECCRIEIQKRLLLERKLNQKPRFWASSYIHQNMIKVYEQYSPETIFMNKLHVSRGLLEIIALKIPKN